MSENLLMMIEKQILVKIDLSVKYYFTNRELDLSHFTFLTKHFPTNKSDIEHSILKFVQNMYLPRYKSLKYLICINLNYY